MHKRALPRLLWVGEEYRDRIRAAEIDYVRALVRDIESGTLEDGRLVAPGQRTRFRPRSTALRP
jgi:hypothetical protein